MTEITTQQAFDHLTAQGYAMGSVWHINDVAELDYVIDDKTARELIDKVTSSEFVNESISEAIHMECERMGLEEIDEE
jgi:hypothetical protein